MTSLLADNLRDSNRYFINPAGQLTRTVTGSVLAGTTAEIDENRRPSAAGSIPSNVLRPRGALVRAHGKQR